MRNTVSRQRQTLHTEYSVRLGSTDRPPLGDKSLRLGGGMNRENPLSVCSPFSLSVLPWRLSRKRNEGRKGNEISGQLRRYLPRSPANFLCRDGRQAPPRLLAECSLCRCTHSVEARLSPVAQWASLCTTARRDGSLAATWKSPVKRKQSEEKKST